METLARYDYERRTDRVSVSQQSGGIASVTSNPPRFSAIGCEIGDALELGLASKLTLEIGAGERLTQ